MLGTAHFLCETLFRNHDWYEMALLLLHLPTLALTSVTTLVYPLYSSYKAVTDPATTLAEMEIWLVYWSIYACWTLLESMLGFLWSWVPFYYEIRLAFQIWLVAPHTRGAMYLYVNHLHPFLRDNQGQIDQVLEQAKRQSTRKLNDVLANLWGMGSAAAAAAASGVAGSAESVEQPGGRSGAPAAAAPAARHAPPGMGSTPAPPTQHNPAQAPLSLISGLLRQYAPIALASAKQLFDTNRPDSAEPLTTAYSIPTDDVKPRKPAPAPTGKGKAGMGTGTGTAQQRRRELERQLAALDSSTTPNTPTPSSSDDDGVPVTLLPTKSSFAGLRAGATAALRNRQVSSTGATLGRNSPAGLAGIGSSAGASAGGGAGAGRRASATGANGLLGESYDLLDQYDTHTTDPLLPPSLQPGGGGGGGGGAARRSSRGWIPWSPSSPSSPHSQPPPTGRH